MPWYACLLASLMLAGVMPVDATTPTQSIESVPPPVCHDTDNENGFGGTHVYCDYGCPEGTILNIGVVAHDQENGKATAAAWTSCGGTDAYCDLGTGACDGSSLTSSPPRTTRAGSDDCHGRSYEAIDSSVTISCAALGVDADICKLVPEAPGCGDVNPPCSDGCPYQDPCEIYRCPDVRNICVGTNPWLDEALTAENLGLMLPTPPSGYKVVSMVAAHVVEGVGVWILFGEEICTAGFFS